MIEVKPISDQEAWRMLNQGAAIVTVNRRLAKYLTAGYTAHQLDAGLFAWETPDIFPFSVWLQRLYEQGVSTACASEKTALPVLLSATQELRVWEDIIYESAYGKGLLQIAETAKIAVQTWGICMSWHLPMDEISGLASDDTAAFLAWADIFQKICREKGWLDNERLGDAVCDLFTSDLIMPPEVLILAGFDELTPQEELLITTTGKSGADVYVLSPPSINRTQIRMGFADDESEMTAAAKWARARCEENSGGRIGVIVPDLAVKREKIIRIFDDVLHPSDVLSSKDSKPRIYNVSLGKRLLQYPVVGDALLMIGFAFKKINIDEYGQWLRSPFWAGAEKEFTARAMLDVHIRKMGDTNIPMAHFMETAKKISSRAWGNQENIAVLLRGMNTFMENIGQMPDREKPAFWARYFTELLETMGWPGDRALESDEYQTVSAWRDLLHKFAEMDSVARDVDMASAFSDFKRLVDDTIFQPESAEAPIQVMGLLEPAGEAFAHLWMTGLHTDCWPQSPHPNPLLPVRMQRRLNVPHASAEREYAFADRIIKRLLASATEAVVSYPVSDGETDLYPTPLIAGIFEQPGQHMRMRPSDGYWSHIQSSISFEQMKDHYGPRIEENIQIGGGTGILKAQAACPFSSFAKYRLKAEQPEAPVSGLSAAERGGLVHHALQYAWEILKSHGELISRDISELTAVVDEAVGRAIDKQAQKQPGTFTDRFAAIEKERLKSLLMVWLEQDKQRSPFTVVCREKKTSCSIGGIKLHTIADRIDQLDDGRFVIVDYKTGEISEKNWFTPRMAEPQLPLYTIVADKPVAGVLFAQVKKGAIKYLGIADSQTIVPDVNGLAAAKRYLPDCTCLEDVMDFWREKLEMLAVEFKEGLSVVSPVSIHTSCRYCDFSPICRIGEIAQIETSGEQENES